MNLELHILQSFSPSNLNRDDTGSPKDCDFGGVRRARISSQCWKRAMRLAFQQQGLLESQKLSVRTRLVAREVARRLVEQGKDADVARKVAEIALAALDLKSGKSGDSGYLLFVPKSSLNSFVDSCLTSWADLEQVASREKPDKAQKKVDVPEAVRKSLGGLLWAGSAADLALFGRMIADRPNDNVVAASQVAHAISTHRVDLEFDYYTAVDDLQTAAESGAGMIGSVEYNAACFYRYANLDLGQLSANLDNNAQFAREAAKAFFSAAVSAVPSGKQNSMAAQNPPSFVLAVVRNSGLWSLSNAFLKPIRAKHNEDLVEESIKALGDYWTKLTGMYGEPPGCWLGASTLHNDCWTIKSVTPVPLQKLIETAMERTFSGSEGA